MPKTYEQYYNDLYNKWWNEFIGYANGLYLNEFITDEEYKKLTDNITAKLEKKWIEDVQSRAGEEKVVWIRN